jgi:hypothetical protein
MDGMVIMGYRMKEHSTAEEILYALEVEMSIDGD